jgi:hypothetical protein
MKKFILIFILLIIAAGVVFYFGWVNVPPGSFAIAHSTLTGTVDYPLESGEINWLWQKLVPKSFHNLISLFPFQEMKSLKIMATSSSE